MENVRAKQMRIESGGYKCPKCGNVFDEETYSIKASMIKGVFRNYPSWLCTKCGWEWKWKM